MATVTGEGIKETVTKQAAITRDDWLGAAKHQQDPKCHCDWWFTSVLTLYANPLMTIHVYSMKLVHRQIMWTEGNT